MSVNLDDEMPALKTANEMRRILASDPVAQAKFFNLMMQLFFTTILGVSEPLQREYLPAFGTQHHEDGFAATTFGGCFGDVGYVMGPIETQGGSICVFLFLLSSTVAGSTFAVFKFCWVQHLLCSSLAGFKICWIQVLLDSRFAGFNCCWFRV